MHHRKILYNNNKKENNINFQRESKFYYLKRNKKQNAINQT